MRRTWLDADRAVDAVEPVQDVTALQDLTNAARDAASNQGYQLIAEVLAAGA